MFKNTNYTINNKLNEIKKNNIISNDKKESIKIDDTSYENIRKIIVKIYNENKK